MDSLPKSREDEVSLNIGGVNVACRLCVLWNEYMDTLMLAGSRHHGERQGLNGTFLFLSFLTAGQGIYRCLNQMQHKLDM